MGISISDTGEITDIPFPPMGEVAEVDLGRLTDGELRKLAMYRGWVLDGTPQDHEMYGGALRAVEEVTVEMATRLEARAGLRGHDPSLCEHPVRCTLR
ncbi:hypothetical protein [Trebonia kvetii]|uniref:hypothetical protein n=1 Tax=Trebonia kvetii TaxID=2480626 RepID=UPI001652423E|nr:hypothetical protein [Trebonia kvetii]